MFSKIKEAGSLLVDKHTSQSEAVKDLADLVSHEHGVANAIPDAIKHEKESAFWYNALAVKECKEYDEHTKRLMESVQQSNAVADAYNKARDAEIVLLKQMLERYKQTDKLEKGLASAEKKKAKATPQTAGSAEAEYNSAKQLADRDRAEIAAFSRENIKQALLLKHKAILDYHVEAAKLAQQQFDIVNSMAGSTGM